MSHLSRREIIYLGVSTLSLSYLGCKEPPNPSPRTLPSLSQSAQDLLRNQPTLQRTQIQSARTLGKLWLRSASSLSEKELIQILTHQAPIDPQAYRTWLLDRHKNDFQVGKVHELSGWVLSQTELYVYALTALL